MDYVEASHTYIDSFFAVLDAPSEIKPWAKLIVDTCSKEAQQRRTTALQDPNTDSGRILAATVAVANLNRGDFKADNRPGTALVCVEVAVLCYWHGYLQPGSILSLFGTADSFQELAATMSKHFGLAEPQVILPRLIASKNVARSGKHHVRLISPYPSPVKNNKVLAEHAGIMALPKINEIDSARFKRQNAEIQKRLREKFLAAMQQMTDLLNNGPNQPR